MDTGIIEGVRHAAERMNIPDIGSFVDKKSLFIIEWKILVMAHIS